MTSLLNADSDSELPEPSKLSDPPLGEVEPTDSPSLEVVDVAVRNDILDNADTNSPSPQSPANGVLADQLHDFLLGASMAQRLQVPMPALPGNDKPAPTPSHDWRPCDSASAFTTDRMSCTDTMSWAADDDDFFDALTRDADLLHQASISKKNKQNKREKWKSVKFAEKKGGGRRGNGNSRDANKEVGDKDGGEVGNNSVGLVGLSPALKPQRSPIHSAQGLGRFEALAPNSRQSRNWRL